MHPIFLGYIKVSLFWFALAAVFGATLTFPAGRELLYGMGGAAGRMHGHLMLAGFVIHLIMGVAYHILPRFQGVDVYSYPLANFQLWLGTIALAGLALSFLVGALGFLQPWFGTALAVAFLIFVFNLAKTVGRR